MMTARKTNLAARLSDGVKLCNLPRNMRQFRLAQSFAPHVIIPTREPLMPRRGRHAYKRLIALAYDVLLTSRTDPV